MNELLDTVAIQQVIARYCRAVDRNDPELQLSCYWPEACHDHGVFRGSPEEFVAWAQAGQALFAMGTHTTTPSLVEVQDQRAIAETGFAARMLMADRKTVRHSGGRYLDLFEKRQGEWRILLRQLVFDWDQESEANPFKTWTPEQDLVLVGRPNRDDPSYGFRSQHGFNS